MQSGNRISGLMRIGALAFSVAIVAAACGTTASQAPAASSGGTTSQAPAGSASSGTGGTTHVAIVDKDMTADEIKAAIAAEGSVVVGNWTYTANDELVNQFQIYVKDKYGADI
jgi:hypothetical protein